jgi:hypothetical protein
MGKVEIKIRKKILTPDNLQQYRNYPALLKKYERNKRFKRALKIFLYSLALTVFVLALIFMSMWKVLLDKNQEHSGLFKYVESVDTVLDTIDIHLIGKNINDSVHSISLKIGKESIIDTFDFPVSKKFNRSSDIQLLSQKIYSIDNRSVTVLKYTYGRDDLNIRSFYYYAADFGVLIFHYSSSSHFAYSHYELKLAETGNSKKDRILPVLTKKIRSDTSFYTNDFY